MFREFAKLLVRYNDSIVASFVYARVWSDENHEEILRRLSNGPLESFNNKPSALRTASHGISNFSFFRNRLLWATRDVASILAVPKKKEDIINKTDKKRGPYKKKK